MITIKVDKKGIPIEVVKENPTTNLYTIPEYEKIFKLVDKNRDTDYEYSDLLGDNGEALSALLNSTNESLYNMGVLILLDIINSYNEEVDSGDELPDNADELYKYLLTGNSKFNSTF